MRRVHYRSVGEEMEEEEIHSWSERKTKGIHGRAEQHRESNMILKDRGGERETRETVDNVKITKYNQIQREREYTAKLK